MPRAAAGGRRATSRASRSTAGRDGLAVIRRLDRARRRGVLRPGGVLVLEIGEDDRRAVASPRWRRRGLIGVATRAT